MPLMSWQLWLAREVVRITLFLGRNQVHLTPGRVAQGFAAILAVIHTRQVNPNSEESRLASRSATKENSLPVVKKYIKTKKSVKQQNQQPA